MTKKCNRLISSFPKIEFFRSFRRSNAKFFFCGFIHIFCLISIAPAADTSAGFDWIIGAEKFSLANKKDPSPSDDAALRAVPSLILEQLAENLERVPTAEEKLDRSEYALSKSRTDLFLQLSREVQVRDSLVLGNHTEKQLAGKLREADKKIAELKIKIEETLIEEEKEREKAAPDMERERRRRENIEAGAVVTDRKSDAERSDRERFISLFRRDADDVGEIERVSLYKGDFSALFDAGEDAKKAGYESRSFENAVVAAKINALLTGTMTSYGDYVFVSVSLIVYPGAKVIGTVSDVGSLADIRRLAVRIARRLTPEITNAMPVELLFTVSPPEAAGHITISVDDIVYREVPDRLVVQAGVHSVLFSAPGFKQAGTSYAFRGARSFSISAELVPDNPSSLFIRLKKPIVGTLFANGTEAGKIDEENLPIKLIINDEPVLGQFITEDGSAAPFYIAYRMLKDNASLAVRAEPFDRSKYIDTRRRRLYTSYSVLITSLLATFYTYGTFYTESIAYSKGYTDIESAKKWQSASQVCTGISIGCGAWCIYELVRYFIAADKVLPARARTVKDARDVGEAESISIGR
ncbi:hypothetical protein [Treponema socranskii]|uniref:hypothetical protein n=1 Tax=Treponema socranskii TaxID=53419 RepID=UPI003D6FA137